MVMDIRNKFEKRTSGEAVNSANYFTPFFVRSVDLQPNPIRPTQHQSDVLLNAGM